MKKIHRVFLSIAVTAMVVAPLLITIYLLFLSPNDVSARQTGKQRIFGATYMTMNTPYFQMLDAQIQGHLELHGDVLLTRDAAMDQERQNQEIQELVDAGVSAIFMTPVEWDTSKEGLRIAAAAGVPVIVVDAPVQASELAACSVLSDNYQAGVLCAEHLLSVRDSAKILLLEHITARSFTQSTGPISPTPGGSRNTPPFSGTVSACLRVLPAPIFRNCIRNLILP